MKKVLSTKLLDKDALSYGLHLGMEIQCTDFIEQGAVDFSADMALSQTYDALAFTSANAVKYFFEQTKVPGLVYNKKIFALSGKTNEELTKHGFSPTSVAKKAADLAAEISKAGTVKSVLHICGNLSLDILPANLAGEGIKYTSLVVYQTVSLSNKKLEEKFDGLMFYSPSGIDSFFKANGLNDETICCCIGETTADYLKEKQQDAEIILPNAPTPKAMIKAISQYFKIN